MNTATVTEPAYDDVLGGTLLINSRVVAVIGADPKDSTSPPHSQKRKVAGLEAIGDDATPILVGRDPSCHVVVNDPRVSAVHFELVRTARGVRFRDRSQKNEVELEGKIHKFRGETYLRGRCSIRCGSTLIEFIADETTTRIEKEVGDPTYPLAGESPGMRSVFALIRKVAPLQLTTLITGETGTGKELAARAIHFASPRAKKPFVAINCGAIPDSLAESTLFGHKRGAFTGAFEDRVSPFVQANGGTIFLDEIGDASPAVQLALLRVIAEREVQAVGSNEIQRVDVRILAATRRPLDLHIGSDDEASDPKRSMFRSDLFFRIAQVRLELPPLRERPTDIRVLTTHFARQLKMHDRGVRITEEGFRPLEGHDWPGNVRELQNVVTVAIEFATDGDVVDFRPHMRKRSRGVGLGPFSEVEQKYLEALDRQHGGNQVKMAETSELARRTLRDRLRKYGLAD